MMAYKIQYEKSETYRYPQSKQKPRFPKRKIYLALLALAAVLWVRMKGIPDVLIPGDPQVTRMAVETMVENLQGGVSVGDAVTAFCKEIMNGESS